MQVFDFGGKTECKTVEELNLVLANRYGNDANELELYGDQRFPFITILIRGQNACVHYFESEADCGHYAYVDNNELPNDGYTTFYLGSITSETEVSNDLVIPFSLAQTIAHDFFLHLARSEKAKWFEL